MTTLPFGQVAPISRRAVAYVIDALIAAALGIVLGGILITVAVLTGSPEGMIGVLLIGGPLVSLALLGWMLLYTAMQSGKGSIGMRAQGVRLADAATGESIGFWRALLRNVIFGLAGSIVVGYFTPLFDGSGRFQGWHDKVAKSVVLDARVDVASPATTAMPTVTSAMPAAIPSGYPPPASQGGFASSYASSSPGQPPAPQYANPAAPNAAPAYAPAPATSYAPPSSASATDETIVPPRPPLPAAPIDDASSLIAFVPGVTQDAAPPRPSMPVAEPAITSAAAEPSSAVSAPAVDRAPAEPVAPSAPVASAAPAASFSAPDDDDIEQTRISVPGHRLVFTWDDGARVSVSRRTIFGRNPAPEDGALIVPVRDETLSLSKTHFEAAAETSGGWLLDRNSTNGTTIIRDGEHIECPPGERVPIKLGDVISIGDRIVTVGGYA